TFKTGRPSLAETADATGQSIARKVPALHFGGSAAATGDSDWLAKKPVPDRTYCRADEFFRASDTTPFAKTGQKLSATYAGNPLYDGHAISERSARQLAGNCHVTRLF